MFNDNLLEIKKELNKHHRDKSKLLAYYIQERLSASLQSYYKELTDSYTYLETKEELKTLRKLNKDE